MQTILEETTAELKHVKKGKRYIEIMDTTLRDGEQTSGVAFSASEKLTIAQLLLTELKVDRIEIASARVPVDVPKRTCRAEHPLCVEMFADADERQQCSAAVEVMRRLLGGPAPQLTLEGLRQALRAEQ